MKLYIESMCFILVSNILHNMPLQINMSIKFSLRMALRSQQLSTMNSLSLIHGLAKDENGRKKSHLVAPVFLYHFCLFPYLRTNTEIGREARRVYPARICGIPFLTGMIPYQCCIYKIRKRLIRHIIYSFLLHNINGALHV